jgi:hypothetical protein
MPKVDPVDAALIEKLTARTETDELIWTRHTDWLGGPLVSHRAEIGGATAVLGGLRTEVQLWAENASRDLFAPAESAKLRTAIEAQRQRLSDQLAAGVASALDHSSPTDTRGH